MKGNPYIQEPTCIEMHLHQANDGQFQANFIGKIISFRSKPSGLGSSGLKQQQLSWSFLELVDVLQVWVSPRTAGPQPGLTAAGMEPSFGR